MIRAEMTTKEEEDRGCDSSRNNGEGGGRQKNFDKQKQKDSKFSLRSPVPVIRAMREGCRTELVIQSWKLKSEGME